MSDGGVATAPAGGPDPTLTPPPSVSLATRYQKLFEGALLAIYVARPDGRLIACNGAFARMLQQPSRLALEHLSVGNWFRGHGPPA